MGGLGIRKTEEAFVIGATVYGGFIKKAWFEFYVFFLLGSFPFDMVILFKT